MRLLDVSRRRQGKYQEMGQVKGSSACKGLDALTKERWAERGPPMELSGRS